MSVVTWATNVAVIAVFVDERIAFMTENKQDTICLTAWDSKAFPAVRITPLFIYKFKIIYKQYILIKEPSRLKRYRS